MSRSKSSVLPGTLSISRVSGGGEEDEVRIRITDESSHATFLEAKISLLDFAHTLMGNRDVPCMFELRGLNVIGSTAENKTELVPFDMYKGRDDEKAQAKALAPFEVDGWRARKEDMKNGHCREGTSTKPFQRVVFFRHVRDGKPVL